MKMRGAKLAWAWPLWQGPRGDAEAKASL
jgi:hypothetical protein